MPRLTWRSSLSAPGPRAVPLPAPTEAAVRPYVAQPMEEGPATGSQSQRGCHGEAQGVGPEPGGGESPRCLLLAALASLPSARWPPPPYSTCGRGVTTVVRWLLCWCGEQGGRRFPQVSQLALNLLAALAAPFGELGREGRGGRFTLLLPFPFCRALLLPLLHKGVADGLHPVPPLFPLHHKGIVLLGQRPCGAQGWPTTTRHDTTRPRVSRACRGCAAGPPGCWPSLTTHKPRWQRHPHTGSTTSTQHKHNLSHNLFLSLSPTTHTRCPPPSPPPQERKNLQGENRTSRDAQTPTHVSFSCLVRLVRRRAPKECACEGPFLLCVPR